MEPSNEKKSIQFYMRALHRDIGFLVIGLTLIFTLSGVLLIFRDSGFLKSEKQIERRLDANLKAEDLGKILHQRDFKIEKEEGDLLYFRQGTYNKSTGLASYSENSYPGIIEKLNQFHKSSHGLAHWFTAVYAIALLFLAISSFWMFKKSSRLFKRGMVLAGLGVVIAIVLLFI